MRTSTQSGGSTVSVREVVLLLPHGARRASHACAFVRGALTTWRVDEAAADDVEQVASELVAQAVDDDSAPGLQLRVVLQECSVLVEVSAGRGREVPLPE